MANIYDIRRANLREIIARRFAGSQTELARAVGLKQPSFVSRLLTERESARKNIGNRLARRIEAALDLSENWLDTTTAVRDSPWKPAVLYARTPRLDPDTPEEEATLFLPNQAPNRRPAALFCESDGPAPVTPESMSVRPNQASGPRRVPLLDAAALAQFGELEAAYESKTTLEWISANEQTAPPHVFAVRIVDDSMSDRFPAGSIVIIDDTKSPRTNDFVLAILPRAQSASVRQWVEVADRHFLVPLNRNHQAVEVTPDSRLLGVVVQATLFFDL